MKEGRTKDMREKLVSKSDVLVGVMYPYVSFKKNLTGFTHFKMNRSSKRSISF